MAYSTVSAKSWKAAHRPPGNGCPSVPLRFLKRTANIANRVPSESGRSHPRKASRIVICAATRRASTYGLIRTLVRVQGPAVGVRLQKAFKKLGRLGNET